MPAFTGFNRMRSEIGLDHTVLFRWGLYRHRDINYNKQKAQDRAWGHTPPPFCSSCFRSQPLLPMYVILQPSLDHTACLCCTYIFIFYSVSAQEGL